MQTSLERKTSEVSHAFSPENVKRENSISVQTFAFPASHVVSFRSRFFLVIGSTQKGIPTHRYLYASVGSDTCRAPSYCVPRSTASVVLQGRAQTHFRAVRRPVSADPVRRRVDGGRGQGRDRAGQACE